MIEVRIHPDFEHWRQAARDLLSRDVPPEQAWWTETGDEWLPLGNPPPGNDQPVEGVLVAQVASPRVPREFVSIARYVACHRDADRWTFLYRVLWRLTHGEPHLLDLMVDPEIYRLLMMQKAVTRDRHKMTAFVRFRKIVGDDAAERYVAWHRPDHHIVRLAAPFFAERFAAMHWTILTPDESVTWDRVALTFGPGVARSAAPAGDELESLWKTYYGSIFNPARVNLKAMRAEMPMRHWATLPEAEIIGELLADAPRRINEMICRSKANARPAAVHLSPAKALLSLPQLRELAASCKACDIHCHATQTVFGEGPVDARIVFVGEQPGDEEDIAGRPFVGPAGKLLDQILQEVGIDRGQVYVTNAVKHFKWEPRGTRRLHKTPSSREVVACAPWLESELSLIRPQTIVCLGATAARAVMGRDFQLTKERGISRATRWAPQTIATWHPSLLLRIPDAEKRTEARRQMAEDLALCVAQ